MAEITEMEKASSAADDISEVASLRSSAPSLQDETLPSYEDVPPSLATTPVLPEKASHPLGPTASSPFAFPAAAELPAYESAIDIAKPLAVPQIFAEPAAPLLAAYPPQLLSYGIPEESWYLFVDTVSAFLSANISKQALHHATDVANQVKEYHTQYAEGVVQHVKRIGKEARRLNVFGVVGGSLGLVFGTVGHAVGTVVSTPLTKAITTKPKTARERAAVYIVAANRDWFSARGLRAQLVSTAELAAIVGVSMGSFLAAVRGEEVGDAAQQLASLRQWIGELKIRKVRPTTDGQVAGPEPSSKAAGKRRQTSQLQLSSNTLWLVVLQEKKAPEISSSEGGSGVQGRYHG